MSEQSPMPPDMHEHDQALNSLLEVIRRVANIARGTKGIIFVEDVNSYGVVGRSLELDDGCVYIKARSFVGADLSIHLPGARIENLSVLAEIRGVGRMSCDIRNERVEEVSYIDTKDPAKVWRNEHTPECRAEALALLELALGAVLDNS